MTRVFVVTGTDTGVGKTIVTVLLTRHLQGGGVRVRAVKPLSSGTRGDARMLAAAQGGGVPLEAINPWHFPAPLAPVLAARRAGGRVSRAGVLGFLRAARRMADVLLIEGAGGLLTPLAPGLDARDLIAALRAVPVLVCPNRLGALNQVRLALGALPAGAARRARLVLVERASRPAAVAVSNRRWLAAWLGAGRVVSLPWLSNGELRGLPRCAVPERLRRPLARLLTG